MQLGLSHFIAAFFTSLFAAWLSRTERFAAREIREFITWKLKQLIKPKGKSMEQDIKLGNVGDLDLSFSGGKATVKLTAGTEALAADGISVKSESSLSMDSSILVDKLFAAIEKASPPGVVALEDGVKIIIKAAITAL